MAQQISANGLAESVMAFNTNYSDSGLFGVYAVAKVALLFFLSTTLIELSVLLIDTLLPRDAKPGVILCRKRTWMTSAMSSCTK